jgi:hypothetical protein
MKARFQGLAEVKIINLFKLLGECISKEIAVLDKQLDYYSRLSEEDKMIGYIREYAEISGSNK